MAELEIVGFDSTGIELEAPQGADTYVAKKAVNFEQPVTTDSTIDGRDVDADGTKLDFITITQPVDLDELEAAVDALNAAIVLKGTWDASVGTFPTSTVAGETWICDVAGLVDGVQFEINDRVTAIVDGASTTVYTGEWLKQSYTDLVLSVAGKTGVVTLAEADITDLQAYLTAVDIDSLAELNALVLDATLGDSSDFATAAQGALAATATQPGDNVSTLVNDAGYLTGIPSDALIDNITAFAGGGQPNATQLVVGTNVIRTVGSKWDSVKLPTAVPGIQVIVSNKGTQTVDVFPFLDDQIGNNSVNDAVGLSVNSNATFKAISTTEWIIL
jgi:hypothetical protein